MSSFTLPFLTGASPTTLRIAARIDSGVAETGLTASASIPVSAAVSSRNRRRLAFGVALSLVIIFGFRPSGRAASRDGRLRPLSAPPSAGAYPGTPAPRAQDLRRDNRVA